ncbi:MAG: hypothetical protein KGZ83_18500 [Sulfuricella sp.]|nr:hypothetical protein [Sulfuricella sp.]
MSNLLCSHCYFKFDDESSYTLKEVHIPGFLTKSGLDEEVMCRQATCPQCGSESGFLKIELVRPGHFGAIARARSVGCLPLVH